VVNGPMLFQDDIYRLAHETAEQKDLNKILLMKMAG
jgi:hypothetical protein